MLLSEINKHFANIVICLFASCGSAETLCHNNTVLLSLLLWGMGGVFQLTVEGRRIYWMCVIPERDASSESLQ